MGSSVDYMAEDVPVPGYEVSSIHNCEVAFDNNEKIISFFSELLFLFIFIIFFYFF